MALNRPAAIVALAGMGVGAALLAPHSRPPAPPPPSLVPQPPAAPGRLLFGTVPIAAAAGPVLAGIVGRLPDDAVALVRAGEGTRPVAIGQTIDGWTLAALDAQAALFARGAERLRVAVPDQ